MLQYHSVFNINRDIRQGVVQQRLALDTVGEFWYVVRSKRRGQRGRIYRSARRTIIEMHRTLIF
jgi:hypothetical protein